MIRSFDGMASGLRRCPQLQSRRLLSVSRPPVLWTRDNGDKFYRAVATFGLRRQSLASGRDVLNHCGPETADERERVSEEEIKQVIERINLTSVSSRRSTTIRMANPAWMTLLLLKRNGKALVEKSPMSSEPLGGRYEHRRLPHLYEEKTSKCSFLLGNALLTFTG